MCGITGMISSEPLSGRQLEQVACMNEVMAHRGPDGAGQFHDGHVALAMRRLSIIDLEGGGQPLYNEDRSLALIANAEIYNFIELRADLRARGHSFRTGSDCEVIVHLYEEYGLDCVQQLRGMFAFALWDSRRRRLVLARDRMGEKPLYLYERRGHLIFASELKALLRSGAVRFELDSASVNRYFHFQYVPGSDTPIRGVRKLAPAHLLTVTIDPWEVKESCYWRMEDARPISGDPSECIRAELEAISEIVIRSDVPVGVALSGGIDSSAVAALAARKQPGAVQAFSVGYAGVPPSDERREAKALADHLGMPFHDVELRTTEMIEFFPELNYWRDEPIADISGYGYYAVMKLANEHKVKVMLQGQGGDELFWGYPWVRQAVMQSLRKGSLRTNGSPTLMDYMDLSMPSSWAPQMIRHFVRSFPRSLGRSCKNYWRDKLSPPDRLVFYDLSPDFEVACRDVRTIYAPAFIESLGNGSPFDLFTHRQPWPQLDILITRLICQSYLLGNGISQGERLGMASSVEQRLPLIDYKLVETVIGLRKCVPDFQLAPKLWLKKAVEGLLPAWIMERPKRGFEPPYAWYEALISAYGLQLVDGYLVQSGILRFDAAGQLACWPHSRRALLPLSFKALVLEMWCRQYSSVAVPA